MGSTTSFSAPVRSSLLGGKLTIQSIEFRKCWSEEEKYQLSSLKFIISGDDLPTNLYYHDLKGMNEIPPLFRDESMINHCCITRNNGTEYRWYSLLWGGEVKRYDTVKYVYDLNFDEIQKPKDIKDMESTFLCKDQFINDNIDGMVALEVTMDEYVIQKDLKTKWGIYQLIVPHEIILKALENAEIAPKPMIKTTVQCPLCSQNNIIKTSFRYHINNECNAI